MNRKILSSVIAIFISVLFLYGCRKNVPFIAVLNKDVRFQVIPQNKNQCGKYKELERGTKLFIINRSEKKQKKDFYDKEFKTEDFSYQFITENGFSRWIHGSLLGYDANLTLRYGTLMQDNLLVRQTVMGKIIGKLNKGQGVIIFQQTDKKYKVGENEDYWYLVQLITGNMGWVSGKYIKVGNTISFDRKLNKKFVEAAYKNDFNTMKKLVKSGAFINFETDFYRRAIFSRNNKIIEYLIKKGTNVNTRYSSLIQTPFIRLSRENNPDNIQIAKLLIKAGAKINAKNENGDSALFIAIQEQNYHFAKFLIDHGADVNTENCSSHTPLLEAVNKGYSKMVKLLLENGANKNIKASSSSVLNRIIYIEMNLYNLTMLNHYNERDKKKKQEYFKILQYLKKAGLKSISIPYFDYMIFFNFDRGIFKYYENIRGE